MKVMKKILKVLGIVLGCAVALVAVLLVVLTVLEYRPADVEAVTPTGSAKAAFAPGDTLKMLTWNIGYGALGDNADFFMDGGTGVYTADEARVRENLNSISAVLRENEPDLIHLQEVDICSDRSRRIDEQAFLTGELPDYAAAFAANFRAPYVPYPIPPMGHVDGGLVTLSRAGIASAERQQLPCPFTWPIRIVNLKRCLLVSRIPVGDRELVSVNLHLEAYDDGEGKLAQAEAMTRFLQAEAQKGNWVIAGGDFNQIFSNVEGFPVQQGKWAPGLVDVDALGDGLNALMDNRVPTCRSLDQPLAGADITNFQFYMIDGFIVSDNVQVQRLETLDEGFIATDHNPVLLEVVLAE